jgi:hypothetical protein
MAWSAQCRLIYKKKGKLYAFALYLKLSYNHISQSFRNNLTIEGDYLRFISLHPDHDSTYRKQ